MYVFMTNIHILTTKQKGTDINLKLLKSKTLPVNIFKNNM